MEVEANANVVHNLSQEISVDMSLIFSRLGSFYPRPILTKPRKKKNGNVDFQGKIFVLSILKEGGEKK